jgi:hypothetical protein
MLVLFLAFRLPAYTGQRLAATAALMWGFAPAGLCLTYLLQAAFEVGGRAGGCVGQWGGFDWGGGRGRVAAASLTPLPLTAVCLPSNDLLPYCCLYCCRTR